MKRMEFLRQEFNEEINRLNLLIEQKAKAKDYIAAAMRQSEVEAIIRAWQIVCNAQTLKED